MQLKLLVLGLTTAAAALPYGRVVPRGPVEDRTQVIKKHSYWDSALPIRSDDSEDGTRVTSENEVKEEGTRVTRVTSENEVKEDGTRVKWG